MIVGALEHRMLFANHRLSPEYEDLARRLIENLNPSSVVNAENVDLAILPKGPPRSWLDIDIILILNLDIA